MPDFKDIAPIQQLDMVLNFMATREENGKYILFADILRQIELVNSTKIETGDLTRVVEKLEFDRYLMVKEDETSKMRSYAISFDGSYQHQKGGYQNLDDISGSQIRSSKNDHRLTLAVAFGASVAAVYYLIEMIRIFFPSWFPTNP